MLREYPAVLLLFLCVAGAGARADQQVVLQSGVTIRGEVTQDEGELVVLVGGASLRFSLADVKEISEAGSRPSAPQDGARTKRAESMLTDWLEARALRDGESNLSNRLLLEAHRLDPGNARVAYWYADSLLQNGMGRRAKSVFDENREAIQEAYPIVSSRLESRIAKRCKLEESPPGFVAAVDRLNEEMRRQGDLRTESLLVASAFRLCDQNGDPIHKSSFRIDSNGSSEVVEAFGDGHYVVTYSLRRSSGARRCTITTTDESLQQVNRLDIDGSERSVKLLGDVTIRRREPSDLIQTKIAVLGADGEPLKGATVAVLTSSQFSRTSSRKTATTDSEGLVTPSLYPGRYQFTVHAPGYTPASKTLQVPGQAASVERMEVRMIKEIRGEVLVAWRVLDVEKGIKGEANLSRFPLRRQGNVGHVRGVDWLRVFQHQGSLLGVVGHSRYGHHGASANSWIRRTEEIDFNDLKFDEYDELKFAQKQTPKPSPFANSQPGMTSFEVEPGGVYFGATFRMEPQYQAGAARSSVVQYKLMVVLESDQEE